MSSDSVDQLTQARAGIYNASHPPLMAWVWHWTDRILPGPLGMILLQNALFWGGVALLAALALPSPWCGAAVLAVGLLPPAAGLLGTVWKDVQMGAAFAAAFALLCAARVTGRKIALLPAALLLFYGTSMRHNAVTAALPLCCLGAWVARPRRGRAFVLLAGVFCAGALALASAAAARALVKGRAASPLQAQQFLLHDLVAISLAEHADYLPDYLHRGPAPVSVAQIRAKYRPESSDPLFFSEPPRLRPAAAPADVDDLRMHWARAVARHPIDYLLHRWELTRALAGLERQVCYPHHFQIDPNPFGIVLAQTVANRLAMDVLHAVDNSALFRGWIYVALLAAVVIVNLARAPAPRWASTALAASGLSYFLPYVVFAPTCDFRYQWWTVIATLLVPLALALERRGRAAEPLAAG
ncbi:MAG TPA: hypothetical protein VFL36_10555 [Myxococcales bacterium]|nr:hypothetical protein [Myxococcales bacterium]